VLTLLLLLASWVGAVEVQSHGLLFEKWLRDTFFGGYEPQGYTQKWDIPASANADHGKIPVNPKAVKHGTAIGLGDALRQFEIEEPFLLIMGAWTQVTPTEKRWVNVQAVRVEPESWRRLWGGITRAHLERLEGIVKDKSLSVDQARAQAKALKSQEPYASAVIVLNPKIDRSQRRLQCSLPYQAFFDHLAPDADRNPQEQPRLFGVPVPSRFSSSPRVLKAEGAEK
jgi:hypothetical protein